MIKTVELDVAQATLGEIIADLGPGEEVVIVRNQQPVARIVPAWQAKPQFGNCRGLLTIVEDDDEHLADFEEYMP